MKKESGAKFKYKVGSMNNFSRIKIKDLIIFPDLKSIVNIVTTKADKRELVVILDKSNYIEKISLK